MPDTDTKTKNRKSIVLMPSPHLFLLLSVFCLFVFFVCLFFTFKKTHQKYALNNGYVEVKIIL